MNHYPASFVRRVASRPLLLKAVINMGWLFLDKALRIGVGLIVGVWVARYLGPDQFGLLSFATAFVGLFAAVGTMGLQEIAVRDIVRDPVGEQQTLSATAALQAVGGVLAYGLMLAAILWVRADDPQARVLVAIIGASMLVRVADPALYWFEAHVQSKYAVWVQNASFIVIAAIKVLLILGGFAVVHFAWAMLVETLLAALGLVCALRLRGIALKPLRARFERVKRLLSDGWLLLLSGLMVTAYMRIDQIMLGVMAGDRDVGVYGAAVRISEIWYLVPMVIVASVFPAVMTAKQVDEALYQERLQRLYCLMAWLSLAVAVPMTFLSTFAVALLYGPEYAEAGNILAIHLWTAPFVFLGVASSKWFVIENRQALSLQRTLAGVTTNVILNFYLIPRWGTLGAAWATVVSQGVAAILFDAFQRATREMFWMKIRAFDPRWLVGRRPTDSG